MLGKWSLAVVSFMAVGCWDAVIYGGNYVSFGVLIKLFYNST
jgi:hypothetical protein